MKKLEVIRRPKCCPPCGGELITISYKEACANWWASLSLSDKDKAIIKTIPNFDANIFAEITGIDATNDLKGGEEE